MQAAAGDDQAATEPTLSSRTSLRTIGSRLYFNHKVDLLTAPDLSEHDELLRRNVRQSTQVLGLKAHFWSDAHCERALFSFPAAFTQVSDLPAEELLRGFQMESLGKFKSDICRLVQLWG